MNIPLVNSQENINRLPHLLEKGFIFKAPDVSDKFFLEIVDGRLSLFKRDESKIKPISVWLLSNKSTHRRKFGGGRGQPIAKAIGFKNDIAPKVLDATVGLGQDAFVLASLGCRVHMLERSPIVAALLCDGLARAYEDQEIKLWAKDRMTFECHDGVLGFENIKFDPDVVYLDPMFQDKNKSALAKKEMRVFQELVGSDLDSDCLLDHALRKAKKVVVKRSIYAGYLAGKNPDIKLEGKSSRFDVYLRKEQEIR